MPPSQLKQLKASLRESGVIGPQQSKKKKQQNAKSGAAAQNRIQRNAALQGIRERFNPFENKAPVKSVKFDVTTRDSLSKGAGASGYVRPGVTKSLGEERRRETLLRELNTRNKVGGILDRRFGENDPTMTPEERAAERFARESQKKFKKESMFNLEDEEDEDIQLTHGGQSLSFDQVRHGDDFQEGDLDGSDEEFSDSEKSRKRRRVMDEEDDMDGLADNDEEEQPERKKSKQEVMKEVIAKSKFYKYERQKAKEDDDELRAQLDKGLPDLFEMVRETKPPSKPEAPKDDTVAMNPDRAALLQGKDREQADREYDQQLKQLTFDKRSKPSDRTKTEEEKVEEEAQRLKKLEEERLRRMRGSEESGSEDEMGANESDDESVPDDAKAFGLSLPTGEVNTYSELGVEDEDDFIIDEDLVEMDSDASLSFIESDEEPPGESEEEDEEEDEMINGLTLAAEDTAKATSASIKGEESTNESLAYTYPCPENHQHFLKILEDVSVDELPTVIQRIRALHHPRLHSDNKAKLGRFSAILVEHVAYMANQPERPPFAILENLLRHIHSLAKSHPENVAMGFRAHLRTIAAQRPLKLLPGDLVVLTGVATIFPTSDHFHAVATPANLSLARYLGQGPIDSLIDFATGAYAASLTLQYQTISKRYIPEFMNYVLNALCVLSPAEPKASLGFFPSRRPPKPLRLNPSETTSAKKLKFWDVLETDQSHNSSEEFKLSLMMTFISLLDSAANLWSAKSAFYEILEPARCVLQHLGNSCTGRAPSALQDRIQCTADKLDRLLSHAILIRRPLLLHSHRPLAIKTSIPKFEENFNPDRHYDPDRERAEHNRLKAEFKRERKGAMRELRKDSNFVAREQLREKKERDAAYEKKYRKLVAEIQGEEGRDAKAYEREKRRRQGKR